MTGKKTSTARVTARACRTDRAARHSARCRDKARSPEDRRRRWRRRPRRSRAPAASEYAGDAIADAEIERQDERQRGHDDVMAEGGVRSGLRLHHVTPTGSGRTLEKPRRGGNWEEPRQPAEYAPPISWKRRCRRAGPSVDYVEPASLMTGFPHSVTAMSRPSLEGERWVGVRARQRAKRGIFSEAPRLHHPLPAALRAADLPLTRGGRIRPPRILS